MRKYVFAFAVLISLIILMHPISSEAASNEVFFKDAELEQAIKKELKLADRDINTDDMLQLKSLFPQKLGKIKDLTGLEYAINLQRLYLPDNEIRDLTPLSQLHDLVFLALNSNQIEDICPISGLTSLNTLIISNNKISNFACISSLKKLTDLLADNNQFKELIGIENLRVLKWVNLDNNQIVDISPLASLTKVEHAYLNNNQIRNIEPLLQIPGLYDVHVDNNPLDASVADVKSRLERNGAVVNQSPSSTPSKPTVISVYVDEKRVQFDRAPFLDEGNTLVQFRPIFEKLGLSIKWNETTRTVTGEKSGLKLEMQIDNFEANVNGQMYTMPAAPRIIDGNTFIPTRFVGEALKYDVVWDGKKDAVQIYTSLQTLTAWDESSTIQLSHQWKSIELNDTPAIKISASDSNGSAVFVARELKSSLSIKMDAVEYLEAVKTLIEKQGFTFKRSMPTSVRGLSAIEFEYYSDVAGKPKLVGIGSVIEGEDSFYRVIVVSEISKYDQYKLEYDKIISTFSVVDSIENQHIKKYGKLKPTARLLDAANFYREKGYFAEWSQLSQVLFEAKFLEYYKEHEFDQSDMNPFDSYNEFSIYADAIVLGLDKERVWADDMDLESDSGSDSYVHALEQLSRISDGKFKPTNMEEIWVTEEGPTRVEFMLNGKKQTIHPTYNYGYLDISIVYDVNKLIKETGYQFAAVAIDTAIVVIMVTPEEQKRLEQERLVPFEKWE